MRSIATPTPPATRKASGRAIRSDMSNSPGALVRITSCTDEGGVGAEHDHLAMGHVDDAHHAEGDGEPDRGKQQHRAEREAVEDVLGGVQDGEPALDRGRCRAAPLRAGAPGRRAAGFAGAPAHRRSARSAITLAAARRSSSGRSLARKMIAACASDITRLMRRSVSRSIARLQGRQRRGVSRLEHRLRGFEPLCRIRREQRQPAHAPHSIARRMPVVDAHRLQAGRGFTGSRLAGRGVEERRRLVLDVSPAARPVEQPPFCKRLDDLGRSADRRSARPRRLPSRSRRSCPRQNARAPPRSAAAWTGSRERERQERGAQSERKRDAIFSWASGRYGSRASLRRAGGRHAPARGGARVKRTILAPPHFLVLVL